MSTSKLVDGNAASVTSPLSKQGFDLITMFVTAESESGTHQNHVVMLQDSDDQDDEESWENTPYSVTGKGNFKKKPCTKKYVRGIVSTPEGSECAITVAIIATNI